MLRNDELYQFQASRFDAVYGNGHSWDIAWLFAKLLDAGLTIVPAVNLIRNIGCQVGSSLPPTHLLANMSTSPIAFPLRHPGTVAVDRMYDLKHVRRIGEGYKWLPSARQTDGTGSVR